jgi:redoxin
MTRKALLVLGVLTSAGASQPDPFRPAGAAQVLVFVASDCPIANGYAPEIQRICGAYGPKGVSCALVYEDLRIDEAAVRKHRDEFKYGASIRAVTDADRAMATRANATVTPEAVVVDRAGTVRYRGRIDNKYVAIGRQRRVVTVHDLQDALDAVLAGRPVPTPETVAFGCDIVPAHLLRKQP